MTILPIFIFFNNYVYNQKDEKRLYTLLIKLTIMKIFSKYSRSEVKGISFPRERWREIDKERGNIPRSKFLLTLIEKAYPNMIHNEKRVHLMQSGQTSIK